MRFESETQDATRDQVTSSSRWLSSNARPREDDRKGTPTSVEGRYRLVMLSTAKHLTPQRARPFPFAALRVTLVSNLCERLWVAPTRTAGLLGQGCVLWVDAANFGGLGDAGDGEQIGTHAQVGLLLGGFMMHSMESTRHDGF